jgi:hypothetical protein
MQHGQFLCATELSLWSGNFPESACMQIEEATDDGAIHQQAVAGLEPESLCHYRHQLEHTKRRVSNF